MAISPTTINTIKNEFPLLKNYANLAYLDNAATTQKPKVVIDALTEFYENYNANVHRGLYPLSEKATDVYEASRKIIAQFINAHCKEVVFVGGTTSGINAIATMLSNSQIFESPTILLSESEHHANILPWRNLDPKHISYLSLNKNFEYVLNEEEKEKTFDIVALSLQSNVTGAKLDIASIKKQIKTHEKTIFILDAAQAIAHEPIDVQTLDVDFLTFSGHKMFGPMGIGVIYGKQSLLEELQPFAVGGGMIQKVTKDQATWAPLPEKFEAGTPPVASAYALAKSVEFIQSIGWNAIIKHENDLRTHAFQKLQEIEEVTLFHPPIDIDAGAILSFSVEGVHAHDIAQYLGEHNIAVRAGHHCTQILHKEVFDVAATTRASFAVYNTKDEIDRLVNKIEEAITVYCKKT